jgi:hypothetical protein
MASSDQTINITQNKLCSRCTKRKTLNEFIRSYRNQEKEFSICNDCSEKKKMKRSETANEDNETLNQPKYLQDINIHPEEEISNDNEDSVLYELAELEELVTTHFTNAEESEVNFSGTFEFEKELIDDDFQLLNNDHDTEEDKIRNLIYHFLLPIEAGSCYYWEIRKIYLHRKNVGQTTVYLGCTQRIDRKPSTQLDNRSTKRISEARPPIDRYPCEGMITINIDINVCHAKVTIQHLMTHEHPTHRENKLPERAIAWILKNLKLRKVEVYKRLCEERLIDSNIHTYRQVYYWASKFSAQQYLTNASNQLLSSLNFLKQNELVDEGYKVIFYLENDFVRALGFLTPFNCYVEKNKINEIVIDSTFKTNQEKFELFVVLINYGGHGVPLAYLYVDTFTAPEDRLQDPRNRINSRVKVLKEFFSLLRSEGILPIFVLVDKDAGQIAAIQEAWSWIANIQLCLWHIKRAIDRKLKEKKYKLSQYTQQRAKEANEQFSFIDVTWIPERREGVLCSEENIKEILNMVQKHTILHPLIPINKEFLTSTEIYHQSVIEAYRYCKEKDLVRLWGYLWTNWYNKADWNLFARASFPKAIPLARTTMLAESHWRVLKYNYKYTCNRPRLDRLTQILTKELIPDQISTWQKFTNNREFPSWWVTFKNEWKIAIDKNINIEYKDKYLTDVNNWTCSCPAFINNAYLVCKHLVKECIDRNPTFFPQYAITKRRHDYPLIWFGEACASIDPTNNPWTEEMTENPLDEERQMNEDSDMELSIYARNEQIESRKDELEEDKKMFNSLLEIVSDNIQNDRFYNTYKRLRQTLITETKACQEALMSRRQQRTWNPPRNSKLAFHLN